MSEQEEVLWAVRHFDPDEDDPDEVLEALRWASEEVKGDREIVMAAVRQDGDALQYASRELWAAREIVWTSLVQINSSLSCSTTSTCCPLGSCCSLCSCSDLRFWLSEDTLRLMPVHFRLILGRFVKSKHPVLSEVPIELFERIGEMFTKEILMNSNGKGYNVLGPGTEWWRRSGVEWDSYYW